MELINKQIFLTELEKFLTFLTEDERQKVLEKMDVLFSAAPSEEELSAYLVSPQKVTVELSRAYDDGGLDSVLERCAELTGMDISVEEAAVEATSAEVISVSEAETCEPVDILISKEPNDEIIENEIPSDNTGNEIIEEIENAVGEAFEKQAETIENEVEQAAEEASTNAAEEITSVENDTQADVSEESAAEIHKDHEVEETAGQDTTTATEEVTDPVKAGIKDEIEDTQQSITEEVETGNGKIKPLNLILFLIVFIPIGIAGSAVLIALALLVIAIATAVIFGGVLCVTLATSGMTLFADLIIVIGAALICFGIGIAILWAGLSILISSVTGYINWIKKIGKNFCVKGGN